MSMNEQEFARKKAANTHLPVSLTLEHVSPVTRLLEKRKQMLQVQESLDSQKDEYGRKEDLFKRREDNLRAKDLELQEALVLFNKFLKENEQKRRRADHRANDEIKKRLKWEKQILAHRISVAALRDKCARLKLSVVSKEKYQKYLERVQDAYATHFDEIGSIITRYQTLKSTNTDINKLQEYYINKNERARVEFGEYKKRQYNATLSLNNDIASESRELEEGVKRTSEVEESMIHQEKEESEEQRISTQIILATDNLYHRCRKMFTGIRRHGTIRLSTKQKLSMDSHSVLKEDTCFKLSEIETYLTDFNEIIESIELAEGGGGGGAGGGLKDSSAAAASSAGNSMNPQQQLKRRQIRQIREQSTVERDERSRAAAAGGGGTSSSSTTTATADQSALSHASSQLD